MSKLVQLVAFVIFVRAVPGPAWAQSPDPWLWRFPMMQRVLRDQANSREFPAYPPQLGASRSAAGRWNSEHPLIATEDAVWTDPTTGQEYSIDQDIQGLVDNVRKITDSGVADIGAASYIAAKVSGAVRSLPGHQWDFKARIPESVARGRDAAKEFGNLHAGAVAYVVDTDWSTFKLLARGVQVYQDLSALVRGRKVRWDHALGDDDPIGKAQTARGYDYARLRTMRAFLGGPTPIGKIDFPAQHANSPLSPARPTFRAEESSRREHWDREAVRFEFGDRHRDRPSNDSPKKEEQREQQPQPQPPTEPKSSPGPIVLPKS
jgi:hypothetical protein